MNTHFSNISSFCHWLRSWGRSPERWDWHTGLPSGQHGRLPNPLHPLLSAAEAGKASDPVGSWHGLQVCPTPCSAVGQSVGPGTLELPAPQPVPSFLHFSALLIYDFPTHSPWDCLLWQFKQKVGFCFLIYPAILIFDRRFCPLPFREIIEMVIFLWGFW